MFTKEVIDKAGNLYSQGIKGGWNKVAEILTAQGYTNNSGGYIHGQAICSSVLEDSDWSHLRKNRLFSTEKRLLIAKAIEAEGVDQDVLTRIMRRIP